MTTDVQNRLISRIFGVLSSGFFAQNNSNMIKEWLLHVFVNFNFRPKLTILQRHDYFAEAFG